MRHILLSSALCFAVVASALCTHAAEAHAQMLVISEREQYFPFEIPAARKALVKTGLTFSELVERLGVGWIPPTSGIGNVEWHFDDGLILQARPDGYRGSEVFRFGENLEWKTGRLLPDRDVQNPNPPEIQQLKKALFHPPAEALKPSTPAPNTIAPHLGELIHTVHGADGKDHILVLAKPSADPVPTDHSFLIREGTTLAEIAEKLGPGYYIPAHSGPTKGVTIYWAFKDGRMLRVQQSALDASRPLRFSSDLAEGDLRWLRRHFVE